ncbi:hypothetical protein BFJ70_g9336 [Fusarium oxysporum]|uniref:Uncharacterized protein n=2 Tax=Fusarium oxysporum TaxID=5507 RepID=A0A420SRW1_FUSOX|nr:uncharacterized protein FOBCDRAFT_13083 [Fusarium oxysporum Fo47]EWZ84418.1 hypothetical protein FOWG_12222 [Fusarium oxysporum f. sp. lycopersici MN25]KAF5268050.1 hypothetical protein FOXYS1_1064 [Fusarium oxysporum]EWZ46414.1 hypothetical protein FOZG_02561 [Fusarium oxysporum Fo47]KAJ4277190.1 hypothetical protein NW764_008431 [Fusarium oxysporum]QKD48768.1 hypothetical protein FOBCDRAFT_13083 [Fusarium oxysporum Fo47]
MSTVSPETTNADIISPPKYTANAESPRDEKIAIEQPKVDDENLPEVVTEQTSPAQMSPPPASEYRPVSTVSPAPESTMNWDGTQSPPILQHPALAQQQYAGHQSMVIAAQQTPQVPPGETVTPLHLLADQADTMDCPFCQRRAETKVKKSASSMTHIYATALFFTTLFGVIFPYACHCAPNISHFCKNCGRKVAFKERGGQMEALGTPDHLREVSKYPAAPPKQK